MANEELGIVFLGINKFKSYNFLLAGLIRIYELCLESEFWFFFPPADSSCVSFGVYALLQFSVLSFVCCVVLVLFLLE